MGEESKYQITHEEPPCKSWKVEWGEQLGQTEGYLKEHLDAAKPFKPQAIFSSDRSSVTILLRDCSMEERRVNDEFTLLFENHFNDEFGNKQLAGIRVDDTRRINRITKAFDDINVILALIENDPGAVLIVKQYAKLARLMIGEQSEENEKKIKDILFRFKYPGRTLGQRHLATDFFFQTYQENPMKHSFSISFENGFRAVFSWFDGEDELVDITLEELSEVEKKRDKKELPGFPKKFLKGAFSAITD